MVKFIWLLMLVTALLCASTAGAESVLALPACSTEEQVESFLQLPYLEDCGVLPAEVQAGMIRYIAQNESKDPLFCRDYWCSVEAGHDFDLTAKTSSSGEEYKHYAGNMCTRAAYAMALSYLGVDVTPGGMSVMMQQRSLPDPYDEVTEALGNVERVTYKTYVFESMLQAYESDPSYSPVYLYMQKPNGVYHALLVVGRADEGGYYLVVDPATHLKDEDVVRVYRIRFNVYYNKIINSTYRSEHRDARVVSLYQWRLTDGTEAEE